MRRQTPDAPPCATLTSDDLERGSLPRVLRMIALELSRAFPRWLLDLDDFVQIGLLGVLSVRAQPHYTPADLRRIQVIAARRDMIDAMRCCWDARHHRPRGRNIEFLADDIVLLAEARQSLQPPEEAWATLLDLQALAAQLTPRQRRILQGRLEGKSHETIGWEFGRTQGWVHLHETPFRHRLREIAP